MSDCGLCGDKIVVEKGESDTLELTCECDYTASVDPYGLPTEWTEHGTCSITDIGSNSEGDDVE